MWHYAVELFLEYFAQRSFGVGGRRCRPAFSDTQERILGKPVQCTAIQLAVRIHRQLRYRHDSGGNHVRRQPFGERGTQLYQVGSHILLPHNKTHQNCAGLATQNGNRGIAHLRLTAQGRLDLTDLHAVATDLDLAVAASHIGVSTVRQATYQVTGAVHALAGTQRVRHEASRGHRRPADIATGQLRPGQIELAYHTVRHHPQRRIQDVTDGSSVRGADRRLLVFRDRCHHRFDRRFGGAIAVVDRGWRRSAQLLPQRGIDCFTAEGQHRKRVVQKSRGTQLQKHRRGGVDHVDLVGGHPLHQPVCVAHLLGVEQVDRMPVE